MTATTSSGKLRTGIPGREPRALRRRRTSAATAGVAAALSVCVTSASGWLLAFAHGDPGGGATG